MTAMVESPSLLLRRAADRLEDEAREAAAAAGGPVWAVGEELSCECCYSVETVPPGFTVAHIDSRCVGFVAMADPASMLAFAGLLRTVAAFAEQLDVPEDIDSVRDAMAAARVVLGKAL